MDVFKMDVFKMDAFKMNGLNMDIFTMDSFKKNDFTMLFINTLQTTTNISWQICIFSFRIYDYYWFIHNNDYR